MKDLELYLCNYLKREINTSFHASVKIEFYPYKSTSVKIFRKDCDILIKYSSYLEDAPIEVLKAAGREMLHRLHRRKPLATDKVIFQQYVNELNFRKNSAVPSQKLLSAKGKYFDLAKLFKSVNEKYFDDELHIEEIGWSRRPAKSYYAHYRRDYDRIAVNPLLDNPEIPVYVMEYLIFHEALHSEFPLRYIRNRLVKHSPEFRRREKTHMDYKKAKAWLKSNGTRLIKKNFK